MDTSIGRIIVDSIEEMLEVAAGLVRRQIQFRACVVARSSDQQQWIITLTGGF